MAGNPDTIDPVTINCTHAGRLAKLAVSQGRLIVSVQGRGIEPHGHKILSCCGPENGDADVNRLPREGSVALEHVIWAQADGARVSITYAERHSKSSHFQPHEFWVSTDGNGAQFAGIVMQQAYQGSQPAKRLLVIINPHGGQGQASKRYRKWARPLLDAAHCRATVRETTHQGHGVEMAAALELGRYDAIVCVSGDGMPYEVFNGLARHPKAAQALDTPVAMIPGGSASALSLNLSGAKNASEATLSIVKGKVTKIDLCEFTRASSPESMLGFLSLSFGAIADCDLGTEHLRWMGDFRFTYGVVMKSVVRKTRYPCDIYLAIQEERKPEIVRRYRRDRDTAAPGRAAADKRFGVASLEYGHASTQPAREWTKLTCDNLGVFYAGKMPYVSPDMLFFPTSLHNDGSIDVLIIDARVPRWQIIKIFLAISTGKHFDMPYVKYYKCSAFRIVPRIPSGEANISLDGERVPYDVIQCEVRRALGTVLTRSGRLDYQCPW